ncbi:hypothetical protein PF008_g10131 [Phytophthora fragariae]|nr:hypothetical protein PF008_g10131 [Phytophthora fragariae]
MVLCPFQNVSQAEPSYPQWTRAERQTKVGVTAADENEEEEEVPRPIGLGIWNEWLDSTGLARVQDYNHGEPCTNGQERQTRVELSCGATNRVVAVEEREMCEYEIRFETPAACETREEEALLNEITQIQQFPRQQDQGDGRSEGHEEL